MIFKTSNAIQSQVFNVFSSSFDILSFFSGPYYTVEQMQQVILNSKVDAVILDIYTAALTKHLWNHTDLRISKLLDYGSTYGVAFAGDTHGVQHCFRTYINNNQARIVKIVEKYTDTLKVRYWRRLNE